MPNNSKDTIQENVLIIKVSTTCHHGDEAEVLTILEENPDALDAMTEYIQLNTQLSESLKEKLTFAADLPTTSGKVDYIRQLANKVPEVESFDLPDNLFDTPSYESALTGAKEKAMAQKDQNRDRDR